MAELTKDKIEDIRNHISSSRDDLRTLMNNYKSNIEKINTNLDGMEFADWEDDIQLALSSRKDSLKNGVVSKLNSSIQENGTAAKLEELIDKLYEECGKYLKGYSDPDKPADTSASTKDPFEGLEDSQMEVIEDIISKIQALRFDSDVEDYTYKQVPQVETQTVTVNQFDRVKVMVDGEEKVMYYLGTDSQGRSYFSETLDDNAPAYVSVWPGQMGTTDADINHWAEQYTDNPWLYQSMVQSQALFVLTGGNTGTLTKGNVLQKFFGSYANGQYVGDSNFNESIVFENSYYAPEIVERGDHEYDSSRAYHVLNLSQNESVAYTDMVQSGANLSEDYHPDIVLEAGQKISTSYTELLILTTNCTIGSDTESVILHYDEASKKYYVVNSSGGYYTAMRSNDATDYGFRSITIEKLNEVMNSTGRGHSF